MRETERGMKGERERERGGGEGERVGCRERSMDRR